MPEDAAAYARKHDAKAIATTKRSANALESCAKYFVENWPIPSVSVWPRQHSAASSDAANPFNDRIDSLRSGRHAAPQDQPVERILRDNPEEILERAFQFFEGYPDVPALLLLMSDGDMTRSLTGDMSREAHWEDGPRRFDSMAESMVGLLLARRERVDAIRAFAGHPGNHLYAPGPPKPGFKPSKFVPEVWTHEQFQQFDRLPTIAVLHRPIRISYRKDRDGSPTFDPGKQVKLMSARQMEDAFKIGFDAALQAIPGGEPARVFYDTAGPVTGANVIPLAQAVTASLPDFALFKPETGIDIYARIGNTGAASPFVQWALAIIAAFHEQDASLTANLRQEEEATITVVTPSTDKRPYTLANPIDLHLSPSQLVYTQPVSISMPVGVPSVQQPDQPASVPTLAIGARHLSGEECRQSGMWRCDPPHHEHGDTHYIRAWSTFPQVHVARKLNAMQKLRGEAQHQKVTAHWILVSYETPKS